MNNYKTDQENFWKGEFGDDYIDRNNDKLCIVSNIVLFSKILSNTKSIKSIIEFGSNIGLNLIALKQLLPDAQLSAIEINEKAVSILKKQENVSVYHQSILDFKLDYKRNFVLIKGVLIHLNPNVLDKVYEKLYDSSDKYICIVEYYNPTPVEVKYRGNDERLFKRDFAGEMLDKYENLKLVNYGFTYHREYNFDGGDFTWFLLEKTMEK